MPPCLVECISHAHERHLSEWWTSQAQPTRPWVGGSSWVVSDYFPVVMLGTIGITIEIWSALDLLGASTDGLNRPLLRKSSYTTKRLNASKSALLNLLEIKWFHGRWLSSVVWPSLLPLIYLLGLRVQGAHLRHFSPWLKRAGKLSLYCANDVHPCWEIHTGIGRIESRKGCRAHEDTLYFCTVPGDWRQRSRKIPAR